MTDYAITTEAQLEALMGEPTDFIKEKVEPRLDESMLEFIARSPLMFLSTIDARGQCDVSPKGDANGFVQVDDNGDLLIPDRPGNKLLYGCRNILNNDRVGIIFVVPNTRETVRVKGRASLTSDPALLERLSARGKPALLCTRVQVDECFFHCGKAMIRSKLWQPDTWENHEGSLMTRQFARKINADEAFEKAVDEEIEKNYKEELY